MTTIKKLGSIMMAILISVIAITLFITLVAAAASILFFVVWIGVIAAIAWLVYELVFK